MTKRIIVDRATELFAEFADAGLRDTGDRNDCGDSLHVALKLACERMVKMESALEDLLGCGEEPCSLVHHAKKDRHRIQDPCPVLARYRALLRAQGWEG